MNRISVPLVVFFLAILSCFSVIETSAFVGPVSSKVTLLEERGLFSEFKNEEYNAEKLVTRGEFLKWAMQNAQFSPEYYQNTKEPFLDIYNRSELHPYVCAAWASGALNFLEGKDKFLPEKKINREEALQILFAIEGISYFERYSSSSEKKWKDLPVDLQLRAIMLKAQSKGLLVSSGDNRLFPRKKLTFYETVNILSALALEEKTQKKINTINDIERVESIIKNNYLKKDSLSSQDLQESAITGMVDSLEDKYSVYLPPKQAKDFTDFINEEKTAPLEYGGIGVSVSIANSGGLLITEVFNGPAKDSGLQVGDIITAVDNNDITSDSDISSITDQIKGVVGTKVSLSILRGDKVFVRLVERKNISLDSYNTVEFETKENIIWISIRSFGLHSSSEFARVLREEINSQTKGVIIDLRYNPGGLMSGAQEMLGEVLDKNHLTLRMVRDGKQTPLLVSGSGNFTDIPLVVFQNEYSASASEIFSASIKDYERGTIIGKKSFGKGIAQNLYNLSNGGTLKLTTSEFLSPLGNTIHHEGITPDVFLENTDDNSFFQVAKRYLSQ